MGRILSIGGNIIKRYSALVVVLTIFSGTTVAYASSTSQITPDATPNKCISPPPATKGQTQLVSVTPCYSLTGKSKVSVYGTNYTAGQQATIIECSDALQANGKPQQQAEYLGNPNDKIPVSCTNPLVNNSQYLTNLNNNGDFSKGPVNFSVITGQTGPPNNDGYGATTADINNAKLYHCPPSRVQFSKGYYCEITVGDNSPVQLSNSTPIFFDLTAPTNLHAVASSATSIRLTWSPSNGGVTYNVSAKRIEPITYNIYRSGSTHPLKVIQNLALSTDTWNYKGLKSGTRYHFYIIAEDYLGHLSPMSAGVLAGTAK